jgi:hypothetical protein
MTYDDIARLERGLFLMAEIKKQERQLEQLAKCDKVKIFTVIGSDRIDFDITDQHKFYPMAVKFVHDYAAYIRADIQNKQNEFDNL